MPKEKGLLHNRANREELVSHLAGNERERAWAVSAADQGKGTAARKKEVKPEHVLPLEGNFKEF